MKLSCKHLTELKKSPALSFSTAVIVGVLWFATPSQATLPPEILATYPQLQYINFIQIGKWKAFIAGQDGALVYDLGNGQWQSTVSLTNPPFEEPVFCIWGDEFRNTAWLVTPEAVFRWNYQNNWLDRLELPVQMRYRDDYRIGYTERYVVIRTESENNAQVFYDQISGEYKYVPPRGQELASRIEWLPRIDPAIRRSKHFPALILNEAGNLTSDGTLVLNAFDAFRGVPVTTFVRSGNGETFLGTWGYGVFYSLHRGEILRRLALGLLDPAVVSMVADDSILAVGGVRGVTLVNPAGEFDYAPIPVQDVPLRPMVSAIKLVKGELWGAVPAAVLSYSRTNRKWEVEVRLEPLQGEKVYDFWRYKDQLYLATDRSVFWSGKGSVIRLIKSPRPYPYYAITTFGGKIWVGGWAGLYVLDQDTVGSGLHFSSTGENLNWDDWSYDPVFQLVPVGNQIWFATGWGVGSYDLNLQQWTAIVFPWQNFRPRGLAVSNKALWVATESGIMVYLRERGTWERLTIAEGLPSNFVSAIALRSNELWIGTDKGLTRLIWNKWLERFN